MPSRIEIDNHQPGPPAFSLVTRELDDGACAVIAVEGELDLSTAPDLKRMLDEAFRACKYIVVDMSFATFLDSTALNVLLGATRRIGGDDAIGADIDPGNRLAIVCERPNVLRIFEFSGLDAAFAIFPAVDEALAHARRQEACTG